MIESDADNIPVPGDWIVQRVECLLDALRARDRDFELLKPRQFLDPGKRQISRSFSGQSRAR